MKEWIKLVVLLSFAMFALVASGCNREDGLDAPDEVNSGIGSQNMPEQGRGADTANTVNPDR